MQNKGPTKVLSRPANSTSIQPEKNRSDSAGFNFFVVCLIFACIKIWLISGEELIAREAWLDQAWFIKSAQNILSLHWLGPYDKFTLARQPGYPLWIVFAHLIHIPF